MDIFEFNDFREFLKITIKRMPKGGHGQAKLLAEAAGISTAFFSQVLSGKRLLSPEQASLIADKIELSEIQAEYFLLLVEIDRSGNQSLLKRLKRKKENLKKSSQEIAKRFSQVTEVSEEDKPIYYSDWPYIAVQQLTAINDYDSEYKIAERLNLPLKQVKDILSFLLKTGLCVEQNRRIGIGPARTHLKSSSPWIKQHHLNWRLRAIQNYNLDTENRLHYSSPMTISKSDFEKIRSLLLAAIDEVGKVVDPSPSEELYCLNMDWFKI